MQQTLWAPERFQALAEVTMAPLKWSNAFPKNVHLSQGTLKASISDQHLGLVKKQTAPPPPRPSPKRCLIIVLP